MENKIKFPLSPFRLFKNPSRNKYFILMVIFWLYTIIWITIIYTIYILNMNLTFKLIALFIEILFTPDISELFISYEKYSEYHKKFK